MCVCVCGRAVCLVHSLEEKKNPIFLHLELLEVGAAFLPRRSHDIQEVWREHEGNPLLTDSHETLIIAQDVAEVDVEEVPCSNTKVCTLVCSISFSFLIFP